MDFGVCRISNLTCSMGGVELLLETHTDTAFLPPVISYQFSFFDITKAPFIEELHYCTSALHNLLCHLHVYQSERVGKGGSRLANNQRWHVLRRSEGQKWKDRIGSYVISFARAETDALCKRQINIICYVL